MGSKRCRPLARFIPKKVKTPKIAAFDIETKGLGGDFIAGAIWTSDGERVLYDTLEDILGYILSHADYLYLAHNGAGYEFAYLAPLIYDLFAGRDDITVSTLLQGDSRIIQIRIQFTPEPEPEGKPKGRGRPRTRQPKPVTVVLQDTLCLFGMALEKVADAYCPELPKLKGNIDFETETFSVANAAHVDYVFRDCEIVLLAYPRFAKDVYEVFGCDIGITAGGTALKAFKTTIKEGHVYYRVNKMAEQFIRKCYYGGLVLPGKRVGNVGNIASIDINGAYAFQMANHSYPVGNPFITDREYPGRDGFYYCRCVVPASVYTSCGFNPLPHRAVPEGLSWPTGNFYTYITTPEIEFARECGCTVEVVSGYVFPRSEKIFEDFVNKCQEMELADGGKYKPTIKQVRNSCYGKFGAKTNHKVVEFSRKPIRGAMPIIAANGSEISGLQIVTEEQEAEYMLPHWAAMVTAYERVYLMRFVREAYARGATTVYCDTDSLKTEYNVLSDMLDAGIVPVHKRYGGFKLEDVCDQFIVLGPKCYYGHLDEELMAKHNLPVKVDVKSKLKILDFFKAKGVPKRSLLTKHYKSAIMGEYEDIEFDSFTSTMQVIKRGEHVRPLRPSRKITNIQNSYAWIVDDRGNISARTLTEFCEEARLESQSA